MPLAFLLALQASGMVVDWFGANEQVRLGKMGAQVEQAGIASNIVASRLQAEDESLQSLKNLRMTLGSQAAYAASRGVHLGSGNSVITTETSVGNFNADERIRKINQSGNEAALRAGQTLSKLHESTYENNTWNQFTRRSINRIPTSDTAWKQIGQGFSAKNNYGFGFTKVGT